MKVDFLFGFIPVSPHAKGGRGPPRSSLSTTDKRATTRGGWEKSVPSHRPREERRVSGLISPPVLPTVVYLCRVRHRDELSLLLKHTEPPEKQQQTQAPRKRRRSLLAIGRGDATSPHAGPKRWAFHRPPQRGRRTPQFSLSPPACPEHSEIEPGRSLRPSETVGGTGPTGNSAPILPFFFSGKARGAHILPPPLLKPTPLFPAPQSIRSPQWSAAATGR